MSSVYVKRDFRSAFCALEFTVDSITLTTISLKMRRRDAEEVREEEEENQNSYQKAI